MERHFEVPDRLKTPAPRTELLVNSIYIIANKEKQFRIRVIWQRLGLYLLNVIDDNDVSTVKYIEISHETYCFEYTLIEAVSARRSLEKFSEDFKPNDIKF